MFRCCVFALLLIVSSTGCSSSSMTNDSERGFADREILLTNENPEATSTPGWLNVKTLQVQVSSTKPEVDDMHINGILVGWRFVAVSDVRGAIQSPPVPARCQSIWLVLEDRSIVRRDDAATAPNRTYLAGRLDPETGLFYPDRAEIVRITAPEPVEG